MIIKRLERWFWDNLLQRQIHAAERYCVLIILIFSLFILNSP